MQFRRQCRLLDSFSRSRGASAFRGLWVGLVGLAFVGPAAAAPASVHLAQLGPDGGAGPSYGYQPYNDRNPTRFYHPNGTGFGHYYLTQKHHGARIRALRYQKFRGT